MRRYRFPLKARRLERLVVGLIAAVGLTAGSAAAQDAMSPPADFASGADTLKPGQYIWTPTAASAGAIVIYVDLSRQLAAVYRGGERIGVTTISSGRPGYETPTGAFTVLQKDPNHRSKKYNDAPMPFQERLTWDGVALHAGRVPGYPESHGCVHLPYSFAKALFRQTRLGSTVIMQGEAPDREAGPARAPSPPEEMASTSSTGINDDAHRVSSSIAPEHPITLVSNKGN